jgi:hypothetical protein
MSFLPEFEDDIFISYAHIDDRSLTEGQKGWISSFHHALETRLAQLLVPEPEVWRDPKLQGNDIFEDKLIKRIPKIAVLISVISPRYLGSEWCMKEMREFYRVAEERRGIRNEDKSRIFKVVKTFVPPDSQPREIQGLLGYEFYQVEKQTGRPRELNPEVDPDTTRSYWRKLDDLAYDIHQLLDSLKKAQDPPEDQKDKTPPISVYLAETTFDLRDERDSIRRELQQRGYTVLPDGPLPANANDFQKVVREYLKRSRLSIHLIGENYGDIPRTETRSHVYLQNELAAEQSSGPDFSRLIWMPVELKATDGRQQEFIEYLQRNSAAQQGAELLQTNLEELKQVIQDKLTAKKEVTPAPVTPGSSPHIYLICDREDVAAIAPLRNYLYDLGYEPILPSFEGSETELREEHKDNLLLCDACLIYYGASNEFWLRSKLRDLQKIAGYGRTQPMSAKCIYIGPNETEHKRDFRTHDAVVIKNFTNFSPASLTPLLAQFSQTQTAKGGRQS